MNYPDLTDADLADYEAMCLEREASVMEQAAFWNSLHDNHVVTYYRVTDDMPF